MSRTITLTNRTEKVTITLLHDTYGTDRWGTGYSRTRPGYWQQYGTTRLFMEAH